MSLTDFYLIFLCVMLGLFAIAIVVCFIFWDGQ